MLKNLTYELKYEMHKVYLNDRFYLSYNFLSVYKHYLFSKLNII